MNQLALRACAVLVVVSALAASCTSGGSEVDATREPTRERVIGPTGGSVEGDGVTLSVPAGALAGEQNIRVTRTTDAAPAGIVALSPIFRFEPHGLIFSVPARVTFEIADAPSNASVMWSSSNRYDTLASQRSGTTISADVVHFSNGFVGVAAEVAPVLDAGADTKGPPDATTSDATTSDATTSDATTPDGACVCPPGLACCGGACRNLSNDPLNCGACNKACGTGETCLNVGCAAVP